MWPTLVLRHLPRSPRFHKSWRPTQTRSEKTARSTLVVDLLAAATLLTSEAISRCCNLREPKLEITYSCLCTSNATCKNLWVYVVVARFHMLQIDHFQILFIYCLKRKITLLPNCTSNLDLHLFSLKNLDLHLLEL